MPPKFLKDFKKEARANANQTIKDIDVSELTENDVISQDKIITLKAWAKKLNVPNYVQYNKSSIGSLKGAILRKLSEIRGNFETGISTIYSDEKDDTYILQQYTSIENFLKNYLKDPKTALTIYEGRQGMEFREMWKSLKLYERNIFVRDYFSLNIGANKINPVSYLQNYIQLNQNIVSPRTLVIEYLTEFILNTSETPEKLNNLRNHQLFPKSFLTKFENLGLSDQLKFAGTYTRTTSHYEPLDAIEKFITESTGEGDKSKKEKSTTEVLRIPGFKPQRRPDSSGINQKNDYDKCVDKLRKLNWLIRPISNVDKIYLGDTRDNVWYTPSEAFYIDVCQYKSYVQSHKENILVIDSNKKVTVEVRIGSTKGPIVSNPDEKPYTSTDLFKDLRIAQTGSIFVKLSPSWIMKTPLYQLDNIYLESPMKNVFKDLKFDPLVSKLQAECRNETYEEYIQKFIIMFFPFFKNKVSTENIYLSKNSSLAPSHQFYIVEKVEKGYLTIDSYKNLTLIQKAPEVNTENLIRYLEAYSSYFTADCIRLAGENSAIYQPIWFHPDVFNSIICPEIDEWKTQDIIIHNGKCHSLPQLLYNFRNGNFLDSDHHEFEKEFIRHVQDNYSHLVSRKFYKKGRNEEESKDKNGVNGENGVNGVEFYIDKEFYDRLHPVVKKTKNTVGDPSEEFDKYFNLTEIIIDPIDLVKKLIEFKNECQKCVRCQKDVRENCGIQSVLDRTDKSVIRVSFCDYNCLLKHKFNPVETLEDIVERKK